MQPVPGPPSPIVNSQHIIEPVLIRIDFPYEFELIVAFALGTFISVDFAGKRLQRLFYQVTAVLTFKNVKRHYSEINNFAGVAFLIKAEKSTWGAHKLFLVTDSIYKIQIDFSC